VHVDSIKDMIVSGVTFATGVCLGLLLGIVVGIVICGQDGGEDPKEVPSARVNIDKAVVVVGGKSVHQVQLTRALGRVEIYKKEGQIR